MQCSKCVGIAGIYLKQVLSILLIFSPESNIMRNYKDRSNLLSTKATDNTSHASKLKSMA